MMVELFDPRFPEYTLAEYKAKNLQDARNIGRAEIVSVYIDAYRSQGFVVGRYNYRIKNG